MRHTMGRSTINAGQFRVFRNEQMGAGDDDQRREDLRRELMRAGVPPGCDAGNHRPRFVEVGRAEEDSAEQHSGKREQPAGERAQPRAWRFIAFATGERQPRFVRDERETVQADWPAPGF